MKTPLALLSLCLALPLLGASEAKSLFQAHQAEILSRRATKVQETLFAVGRIRSFPNSETHIDRDLGQMAATKNLDYLQFTQVAWPEDLPQEARGTVWQIYRALHPFSAETAQGECVYQVREADNRVLAVWAYPAQAVTFEPLDQAKFQEAVALYREAVEAVAEPAPEAPAPVPDEAPAPAPEAPASAPEILAPAPKAPVAQ